MSAWQGLVLGLLQGATEFLPVSSSGHLVIGETLFGLRESGVAFDALVHGATMLAIVAYFRGRIVELVRGRSPGYLGKLVLGTVPAVGIGLALRHAIETAFDTPEFVPPALAVTGTLLLSLYLVPRERWGPAPPGGAEPSWAAAWWIGCAQAIAIFPGISRSGSTIVTGIWLGLRPAAAAEFSFLLGIPAITGAVVLEMSPMHLAVGLGQGGPYLIGAIVAFVSGLAAIYAVLRLLARREFRWFGFYCWGVAIAFALWLAAG